MGYKFTEDADAALDTLMVYIASDNPAAAMRVYEKIVETCEMIYQLPSIGRHPEYSDDPELLYVQVKKYSDYLIFYRKQRTYIEIADIIHGARDLPALFGDK